MGGIVLNGRKQSFERTYGLQTGSHVRADVFYVRRWTATNVVAEPVVREIIYDGIDVHVIGNTDGRLGRLHRRATATGMIVSVHVIDIRVGRGEGIAVALQSQNCREAQIELVFGHLILR